MSLTELKLRIGRVLTGPGIPINKDAAESARRLKREIVLGMVTCMPFCPCLRCTLSQEGCFFEESEGAM